MVKIDPENKGLTPVSIALTMRGGFVVAHNLMCHRAVLDFQFSVMRCGRLLAPKKVLGLEDWRA